MTGDTYMKSKPIFVVLILIAGVVVFSTCQAVFTFSPFSSFQRDPANLPPEQQVAWAESVLAAGDASSMAEAYDIIAALLADDPTNPDLNLLAADLAIGGSGLGNLLNSADFSSGTESIEASLESLDYSLLDDVAAHVSTASENGGTVTDAQYVNAAAALVMSEANSGGGFDSIDWDNPSTDLQQALDFAELGGVDIESLFSEEE